MCVPICKALKIKKKANKSFANLCFHPMCSSPIGHSKSHVLESQWVGMQSYRAKGIHGIINDINLSQGLQEKRPEETGIPRTDQDLRWRKEISMVALGREW